MPWTLAHPAAVLPFGRWLVPGALVAGATAPDVFFHLPSSWYAATPGTWWTHGPLGPVTVDLLVGLALFAGWRGLVRRPVLRALPSPWRESALAQSEVLAPRLRRRSTGSVLWVVGASVAVGAVTHVLLDVLAHDPGGLNPDWAWLRAEVGPFRVYLIAQYGLSLIGVGVLVWWLGRWATGVADLRGFRPTRELVRLLATATAGFGIGAVLRVGDSPIAGIEESVTGLLTSALLGGVAGAAVAVVAWSVADSALRRGRARAGRAAGQG